LPDLLSWSTAVVVVWDDEDGSALAGDEPVGDRAFEDAVNHLAGPSPREPTMIMRAPVSSATVASSSTGSPRQAW